MLLHLPVMLDEVLKALDPRPGQTVVDGTVGLGGHAAELLRRVTPGGRLIGLDLDPANLERARAKLTETGGDFVLRHENFAGLPAVLGELGVERVDGLIADLGVSSPHLDDVSRGFSFRLDGPLDMRMDPTRGKTAADFVNGMREEELADAIYGLGDETDSRRIARRIVDARRRSPIRTTGELARLVCEARRFTPQRAAGAKLHPATRTFQALRMLVNRETANLGRLLALLPDVLKPGGVAVIISFHSGEDRPVKYAFRDGFRAGIYEAINKKAIKSGEEERGRNRRARSAKLRWAKRSSNDKVRMSNRESRMTIND